MARKTKKTGISGKFGARYGVTIRKRIRDVEREKVKRHECPSCNHKAVKRVDTGIWRCRKCGTTFAGGAYRPMGSRGFRRTAQESELEEPYVEAEEE
jgi:large subunit ribosomal protein L37Ae